MGLTLYDNIPPELKICPNWVCGRTDKTPVNPKTGGNAMANVSSTWGTFEEAVRYREAHGNNGIRTIGFEVSENTCAGIDLDHCRNAETGEIEPWASEIIRVLDTYTEISPSGTGIRMFVTCVLPPVNRKKGNVEIANNGKYFSVIGNHLEGTPTHIGYRPEETRTIFEKYFASKAEPKEKATLGPSITDEELLKKAFGANNGAKCKALWEDIFSAYPSHSEADQALCNHLAFWTGNDASRIDSLFRQSGLMRDKWLRDDYRAQTISRAIELISSPVGFGSRYFFQCPFCKAGVSILYAKEQFYCRKCQNITYESCQENHSSWHKKFGLKNAGYRNFFKVVEYSRELQQRKRKGKKMLRRLGKYVKKSGVKF